MGPAENESGTGSKEATPTVLNITCEFDTCPIGSSPEGFNSSNGLSVSQSLKPEIEIRPSSPQLCQQLPRHDYQVRPAEVGTAILR